MPINKMLSGYVRFRDDVFKKNHLLYESLVNEGQKPKVCLIACSDSRVAPSTFLQSDPGDLFTVRNVANLVPPYEVDDGHHGTSAALEFAVQVLKVEHIVVMGHSHCGGIKAMMGKAGPTGVEPSFIPPWVSLVEVAHRRVLATMPGLSEEQEERCCERQAVLVSLENLMTFPCIRKNVANGKVTLHGWYIDILSGQLSGFNAESNRFEVLVQPPEDKQAAP